MPSHGASDAKVYFGPDDDRTCARVSSILLRLFSNKAFRARVHFHTCDVMLGLDTIVTELMQLSQGTLVGAFGAAPRSIDV